MKMITVENEKKTETTKSEEFDIVLKMKYFSTSSPAMSVLYIYLVPYYMC